jgi:hypothetical protein
MKNKNGENIEFICPNCKTKEKIPTEVVEYLDDMDQYGVDTNVPPRFDCEKCTGKMVPIYYVSVNNIIHEYKDK